MSSEGTERKKRDREVEWPKENGQIFQRSKITVRSPLKSINKKNQGDIEMEEVKKKISEVATQIRDEETIGGHSKGLEGGRTHGQKRNRKKGRQEETEESGEEKPTSDLGKEKNQEGGWKGRAEANWGNF
ncbi:hypothetical protein Zmor_026756 [Zophobas morio]|uniref:Uncharacterized protein n=1 Tax=Zophobas morio TaxID=2755281 RepID=A0AA38HUA0_9CUCU|nr:hypothetical protein Zmor_026756 [Zophobas morio]